MKYTLLFFMSIGFYIATAQTDSSYRNYIQSLLQLDNGDDYKNFEKTITIDHKKVIENWKYKAINDSVFYFQIVASPDKNSELSESYLTLNNKLVYATETDNYYSDDDTLIPAAPWAAYYFFKNGVMVDYYSNGHGKSEMDNWYPERYIYKWFKKRYTTLKAAMNDD